VTKFQGALFAAAATHSPFDVVAWRGNYAPYVYDLACFAPVNSVLTEHPDPSIFTVLTVPSAVPGVPIADFVIFPQRYLCAIDTFRPPYFHKNVMSEYMGNLRGAYDAKAADAFGPGCASLHGVGVPHGPDSETFAKATAADTSAPTLLSAEGLAFMFETSALLRVCPKYAPGACAEIDADYAAAWTPLKRQFKGPPLPPPPAGLALA